MVNPDDYRKLLESGVLEEVYDGIRRQLFEEWCLTERRRDREKIFFRQMALEDMVDVIRERAKRRIEEA